MESKIDFFPDRKTQLLQDKALARNYVASYGIESLMRELAGTTLTNEDSVGFLIRVLKKIPYEFHEAIVLMPVVQAIIAKGESKPDLYELNLVSPSTYKVVLQFASDTLFPFPITWMTSLFGISKNTLEGRRHGSDRAAVCAYCCGQILELKLHGYEKIRDNFENNISVLYEFAASCDFLPAKLHLDQLRLRHNQQQAFKA